MLETASNGSDMDSTALWALRHFFQQHFYRMTKSIRKNQLSVSATKVTAWVLDIFCKFLFCEKAQNWE
jgi:hypothetical protein